MAVTWGATNGHMRVGLDVTMSPSTVAASTSQVTLTVTAYAQSVAWGFQDPQTMTVSGVVSGSKGYTLRSPSGGTATVMVGSWAKTVPTSASAQNVSVRASVSGAYNGAAPSHSRTFTVPARPKSSASVPAVVKPAPAPGPSADPTVPAGTTIDNPPPAVSDPGTPQVIDPPVVPDRTDGVLTGVGHMDLIPSSAVPLWSSGRYDAFPYVASASDGRVLTLWRSAKPYGHAVDRQSVTMGALSADGAMSLTDFFTAFDDGSDTDSASSTGVAWDAVSGRWIMVLTWARYTDLTSTTVARRWTTVHASKDAKTWTQIGPELPAVGARWLYANDLAIKDGLWIIAGYGVTTDGTYSSPLTMTSTDQGATWSAVSKPSGLPASTSFAEPRLSQTSTGQWIMLIRTAQDIHQARSVDGVTWTYDRPAIGGLTGNPAVTLTAHGALVMIGRLPPTVDDTHGLWAWAYSENDGTSWTLRQDFPGNGLYNMYGGLTALPDGSVTCVFASEDDPTKLWEKSSVYWMRFVTAVLDLELTFTPSGAPAVEVTAEDKMRVDRVTIDPLTGDEVIERVRVRTLDGLTSRDFELQQGQSATYRAGNRVTGQVTAPVLPHTMLVHPIYPDTLSCRIDIVTDDQRTHDLDAQVTQIPSLTYPVVTKAGPRHAPSGQTSIRTRTLVDKQRLLSLFEDGLPLFWSHHPGLDMPDWIQPLDLTEERFVQHCSSCIDDASDQGQWRTWTLKWVQVARPTAAGLPVRKRIRDYRQPINTLPAPIQEL